MSETNGDVTAAPVPMLAGHLAVYDGVVAFRPDGAPDDGVVRREFPPMLTGLLAKLLAGEDPDPSTLPGLPGMLKVMSGLRRG